jgi:hypothetical protein
VREDREARPDRRHEPLGVVRAEVQDAPVAPGEPGGVDEQEVDARVRLRERVEPVGVDDVGCGEPRRREAVTVRLDTVVVGERRLEDHARRERVPALLLEEGAALDERLGVPEHHRLGLQRVAGPEERAAGLEPAAGHRLDDGGRVACVIEVPVRDHERVDLGGIDLRPRRERPHERARAGVHPDPGATQRPHEPAGVAELGRHREPGAGGAEELERAGAVHARRITARGGEATDGRSRLST